MQEQTFALEKHATSPGIEQSSDRTPCDKSVAGSEASSKLQPVQYYSQKSVAQEAEKRKGVFKRRSRSKSQTQDPASVKSRSKSASHSRSKSSKPKHRNSKSTKASVKRVGVGCCDGASKEYKMCCNRKHC